MPCGEHHARPPSCPWPIDSVKMPKKYADIALPPIRRGGKGWNGTSNFSCTATLRELRTCGSALLVHDGQVCRRGSGEGCGSVGRFLWVCIDERHLGDARSSARAPPYRILKKSGSDCLLLYLFFLCAFLLVLFVTSRTTSIPSTVPNLTSSRKFQARCSYLIDECSCSARVS